MAADGSLCPRCLELEDELADIRQQLAAVGRYVISSPGPNSNPQLEHELGRWLAVHPRADSAAGFRAGWARLARWVQPRLHDWEHRWWRAVRENDQLRSRIGVLLTEISRLHDRG
ncbi:MAG TPA: hypothetical protein VGE94_19840 [Chloroflexota bacterium]